MRKFYKTTLTLVVLSEHEPIGTHNLEDIARTCDCGDWSGEIENEEVVELTAAEAAKALQGQGSDPSFFRLTEDGTDLDDEDGLCANCGEADHVHGCSKPDFITKETWQTMSDDERLEAEQRKA